jgi:CubicO group peptidase (beta-lactamase class C family)
MTSRCSTFLPDRRKTMGVNSMTAHAQNDNFDAICQVVKTEMARLAIPGTVVGILQDGKTALAGFGITSVENPLPVTTETLYQIGSITKTFVATAVMRLVEMGKLALDAPLRTYLPELRLADADATERVTMRHLLTHTGGWDGDYFADFGMSDDALAKMVAKMADLPQLTPVGEVYSYNNAGFYLAGRVIEALTGVSFEAAMQQLVFEPLGLARTFFFAQDVITYRFVVGHQVEEEQPKVARPWALPRAVHPAGGIVCTMGDLLCYARLHMQNGVGGGGEALLSAESLASMQTPMVPASGIGMVGLSWHISEADGANHAVKIIEHGGGVNGQITRLTIAPAHNFAIAVFANSDEGVILCDKIVNLALQRILGIAFPTATPLEWPEARLLPYVGRYEALGDICEIVVRAGGLVLQVIPKGGFPTEDTPPPPPMPPVRFALYGEDKLVGLEEPFIDHRAEFLRDPDGRIAWLRIMGRIHARLP